MAGSAGRLNDTDGLSAIAVHPARSGWTSPLRYVLRAFIIRHSIIRFIIRPFIVCFTFSGPSLSASLFPALHCPLHFFRPLIVRPYCQALHCPALHSPALHCPANSAVSTNPKSEASNLGTEGKPAPKFPLRVSQGQSESPFRVAGRARARDLARRSCSARGLSACLPACPSVCRVCCLSVLFVWLCVPLAHSSCLVCLVMSALSFLAVLTCHCPVCLALPVLSVVLVLSVCLVLSGLSLPTWSSNSSRSILTAAPTDVMP